MTPLRATWQIVRFTPGLYALNALLQALRSALPLIPGLVVAAIFDRLSSGSGLNQAIWLLLALLVGAVLGRVTALFASVAVDGTSTAYGSGLLLRNLLERVLSRPGAEQPRHSVGDTVNRMTTDTTGVSDMLMSSLVVFGSAVQAVIALGIMVSVDPLITVVVAVPMLLAGVLINVTSSRIKKYHAQNRAAASEVSSLLREVFNAVQSIQLANAQNLVMARFREVNDTRRARSVQSRLFSGVFLSSVWSSTSGIGAGIVMLMAASRLRSGQLTVGDVVLFIAYLSWITEFTALFSQNLAAYKQAAVSYERLRDILPAGGTFADLVAHAQVRPGRPVDEVPAAVADPTPRPLQTLRVSGLTFRHEGSGRGFKDVDLSLDSGSFVVITGSVGSGKTTLLRALLGLLPRQGGSITWNGVEITDPAEFFTAPHIAYTPQVPHLVSGTIRENILFGHPASEQDLNQAIHAAVLERDLTTMPDGLETVVGPRGTKLSGGQAQRVAAARMFVRDAHLMVLDDLSSALDVNTERLLWSRLREQPDRTCLVVSHRLAAYELADHIVVLDDGKVAAEGTYDQLRDGILAQMPVPDSDVDLDASSPDHSPLPAGPLP